MSDKEMQATALLQETLPWLEMLADHYRTIPCGNCGYTNGSHVPDCPSIPLESLIERVRHGFAVPDSFGERVEESE